MITNHINMDVIHYKKHFYETNPVYKRKNGKFVVGFLVD